MKRILIILFVLFQSLAWAQTVPNGSFETWVPDNTGAGTAGEAPGTWVNFGISAITKVSNTAQSGTFAVNLKGTNFLGSSVPSLLQNNLHLTSAPKYVNGYFRHTSPGVDTVTISVTTFKNGTGSGFIPGQTTDPAFDWVPFHLEIQYFTGTEADSAQINITVQGQSGGYDFDNFTFSNNAIGSPLASKPKRNGGGFSASVYPNPGAGQVATLILGHISGGAPVHIRIVDALRKMVLESEQAVGDNEASIPMSISTLQKGLYNIVVENAGNFAIQPFVKY